MSTLPPSRWYPTQNKIGSSQNNQSRFLPKPQRNGIELRKRNSGWENWKPFIHMVAMASTIITTRQLFGGKAGMWTIFDHQTIKRKPPRKGEHPQRLEKQRERERVRMRTPSHNRVRAINNLNTPTTHERPPRPLNAPTTLEHSPRPLNAPSTHEAHMETLMFYSTNWLSLKKEIEEKFVTLLK